LLWDLKNFPDGVMQAQQAQARVVQDAANWAAWQNLNQSMQNTNQNIQMQNQNFQLLQMNNYHKY
jgi:hypothetical protein